MSAHPPADASGETLDPAGPPTTVLVAVAALVLLAGLLAPPPAGLAAPAGRVLGVLGAAIVLWAGNALNPVLVALAMMLAWPLLGVLPFTTAAAGFGSDAVWLMIGILLLSTAFAQSGLDRRVVYRLLYLARGRTRATLLWVALTLLVLAFLVPTAAGRAGIMLGICQGMMRALALPRGSNVGKALFMLVAYVTLFSSNMLLTGAVVIVFAAGLFQQLAGHTWTFASWLAVGLPPVLVSVLLCWALVLRMYPPEIEVLEGGQAYLRERLKALGPMSGTERKMALVVGAMLAGWITAPWHGLATHMVGLLAMLAALLPPLPAVPLERALKSMPWHIVLMFGASLSLTAALQKANLAEWLAGAARSLPPGAVPPLAVGLGFMLLSLVMRLGFPNAIALTATVLPIAFVAAAPLGVNPVWLGLLTLVPTQLPLLPMVSPGASILYSGGYFGIADMLRAGAAIAAVVIGVSLLFAFLYWPLLGVRP